jgi:hypothetical protein
LRPIRNLSVLARQEDHGEHDADHGDAGGHEEHDVHAVDEGPAHRVEQRGRAERARYGQAGEDAVAHGVRRGHGQPREDEVAAIA